MIACYRSAPLELVQAMITKAKLESRKRCLLAITDIDRWTALHYTGYASATLTYDYDTDPEKRKEALDFYGYIPDEHWGRGGAHHDWPELDSV